MRSHMRFFSFAYTLYLFYKPLFIPKMETLRVFEALKGNTMVPDGEKDDWESQSIW